MFGHPISPLELIIILVIVLMIFGAGKLPEVGSALGRGIKEFKKSATDEQQRIAAGTAEPAPAPPPAAAPVAAACAPAAAATGPYCPKCGTRAANDSRFCANCGASLPTAVV